MARPSIRSYRKAGTKGAASIAELA